MILNYCIVEEFSQDKNFTDGSNNEKFPNKIFTYAGLLYRTRKQLCLFRGFIFADVRPTAKSVKILSHENFPLYGTSYMASYANFMQIIKIYNIAFECFKMLSIIRRYPIYLVIIWHLIIVIIAISTTDNSPL